MTFEALITQTLKSPEHILAHIAEDKPPETLKAHLDLTLDYFKWISQTKGLNPIFQNFKTVLGDLACFEMLLEGTFYFHDLGKANGNFQIVKMQNPFSDLRHLKGRSYTHHALLSALFYLDYYFPKGKTYGLKSEQIGAFCLTLILNAYIISRHHSPLNAFEKFEENLQELLNDLEDDPQILMLTAKKPSLSSEQLKQLFKMGRKYYTLKYKDWELSEPYIYVRFIYALLVACDFYATSEYLKGEKISYLGKLEDAKAWQKAYETTGLYQSILKNKAAQSTSLDINLLRTKLFWEALEGLEKQKDAPIYYLEAPTGSGKTNTSIGIVLNLLNNFKTLQKVFYVFPFNTLSEQTFSSLYGLFEGAPHLQSQLTVMNSITPIKNKFKTIKEAEAQESLDYEKMLLDQQFLHESFIITSHVKLFQLLFETGREQVGGLYQLANSIIVLDEIQSYKNTLWTEIIGFLTSYAKLLNIKILIMSATLPALGELLPEGQVTRLLTDCQTYFMHPLFKNRVQLDFSLLKTENMTLEILLDQVLKAAQQHPKILIEFIKKKSAQDFYQQLVEMPNLKQKVCLLTGDDNKWERKRCIQEVKSCKSMILVATQIIEAGVDIDMDCGFKNISLLDAEEQFLGRINRSCLRKGKAYFFHLDEAAPIYKQDYRKQSQFTLINEANQKILQEKDFTTYYKYILEAIQKHNLKNNAQSLKTFLNEELKPLNMPQIAKHMTLIDEAYYPVTIFLAYTLTIEVDGELQEIDGREVWETYKSLIQNKDLPYAERKVKRSKCQEQVDAFTWQVQYCKISYNDRIGDLYYIEDGEQYFTNGKFDREKLTHSSFEMI